MTRDGTVGRSDATETNLPPHWDIDPARVEPKERGQGLTDLQEKPGQLRDKFGGNAAQSREQVRPRLYQVHATGLIEQEGHFAAPAADVSSRDDPTAVT
jgi:hypothetical protein